MTPRRTLLRWLVAGIIVGFAILWLTGPRHWSPEPIKAALRQSVRDGDSVQTLRLVPLFVAKHRANPAALEEVAPFLRGMNRPEVLELLADEATAGLGPDAPLNAEALMWRAAAQVMRGNTGEAAAVYREVTERFWNYRQSLEAELQLRKLDGRRAEAAVTEAARGKQWGQVVALAGDVERGKFFPEDRDLIAAHVFEALLALGRTDDASRRLTEWMSPDSGINLPAVLGPARLAGYGGASMALGKAIAAQPTSRWLAEAELVRNALEGRWRQVRDSATSAERSTAVNVAAFALRGGAPPGEANALAETVLARADLGDAARLEIRVSLAEALVAAGDRVAAREVLREEPPTTDNNSLADFTLLRIRLTDDESIDQRVRRCRELAQRFRDNETMVLNAVRLAQELLIQAGRRESACEFGRAHLEALTNAATKAAAVQVCGSP
jgi:tetratricopeptide (TPR) repeat protein